MVCPSQFFLQKANRKKIVSGQTWLVVWLAQLQFGILAAVENHGKNGPQVLASDVKPGKVVHNPTFPGLEGNLLFLHGTPNDKTPNCSYRKERHYGVEADLTQQRHFKLCPEAKVLKNSKTTFR